MEIDTQSIYREIELATYALRSIDDSQELIDYLRDLANEYSPPKRAKSEPVPDKVVDMETVNKWKAKLMRLRSEPLPNFAELKRMFAREIEELTTAGSLGKNKKAETAIELLRKECANQLSDMLKYVTGKSEDWKRLHILYIQLVARQPLSSITKETPKALSYISSLIGVNTFDYEFRVWVHFMGNSAQIAAVNLLASQYANEKYFRYDNLFQGKDYNDWMVNVIRPKMSDFSTEYLQYELEKQRALVQNQRDALEMIDSPNIVTGIYSMSIKLPVLRPELKTLIPVGKYANFAFVTSELVEEFASIYLHTTFEHLFPLPAMENISVSTGGEGFGGNYWSKTIFNVENFSWNSRQLSEKFAVGVVFDKVMLTDFPAENVYINKGTRVFGNHHISAIIRDTTILGLFFYILPYQVAGIRPMVLATHAEASRRAEFLEEVIAWHEYDPWDDVGASLSNRIDPFTGMVEMDVSLIEHVQNRPLLLQQARARLQELKTEKRNLEHRRRTIESEAWDLRTLKKEYGANFFEGKVMSKKKIKNDYYGISQKPIKTITTENAREFIVNTYIPDQIDKVNIQRDSAKREIERLKAQLGEHLPWESAKDCYIQVIIAGKELLDSDFDEIMLANVKNTIDFIRDHWPGFKRSVKLEEKLESIDWHIRRSEMTGWHDAEDPGEDEEHIFGQEEV